MHSVTGRRHQPPRPAFKTPIRTPSSTRREKVLQRSSNTPKGCLRQKFSPLCGTGRPGQRPSTRTIALQPKNHTRTQRARHVPGSLRFLTQDHQETEDQMPTPYIMPLGFIDRPTETGATFILTNRRFPQPKTRHANHGLALFSRTTGPRQIARSHQRRRVHHRHLHDRRVPQRPKMAGRPTHHPCSRTGLSRTGRIVRPGPGTKAHAGPSRGHAPTGAPLRRIRGNRRSSEGLTAKHQS